MRLISNMRNDIAVIETHRGTWPKWQNSYDSHPNLKYRAREDALQINSWEPENRIRIMELIEKRVRF